MPLIRAMALALPVLVALGCASPLPEGRQLENQGPAVEAVLGFWRTQGLPAPASAGVWFVDANCGATNGIFRGFMDDGKCKGGTTILGAGSWVALSVDAREYQQTQLCHEILHLTLGGDEGHAHAAWAREDACRQHLTDLYDVNMLPGKLGWWKDPSLPPRGARIVATQGAAVAAAVAFWEGQGYVVPAVNVRFVDATCGDVGAGFQAFTQGGRCREMVTLEGTTYVALAPATAVTHFRQTTLCHAIGHLVLGEGDPAWSRVYGPDGCQAAVARAGDAIGR
jgi:hypothetical protein